MSWKSLTTILVATSLVGVADPEQSQVQTSRTRGWRGDGTGRFPEADPPVKWGKISRTLKGLSSQAERPKGGQPDKSAHPVAYGSVDEWLILGPIDAAGEPKEVLDKELLPGKAALRPDVGEKVKGLSWRKVASQGAFLDLNAPFPDLKGKAVYAHSYLHSKVGG